MVNREDKIFIASCDIGGTNVKLGIFSLHGIKIQPNKLWQFRLNEGSGDLGKIISTKLIRSLNEIAPTIERFRFAAISIAANCDGDGNIIGATNLKNNYSKLRDTISESLGCPVKVANDGDLAAMGEAVFGAASGAKSSVTVTIGTGVGAGIIKNGKIFSGFNGASGEIGHLKLFSSDKAFLIDYFGIADRSLYKKCGCGKEGCLEQYCSGKGLSRIESLVRLKTPNKGDFTHGRNNVRPPEEIFISADAGDTVAIKAIDIYCDVLGRGLASLACIIDPEVIVIGGGVSMAADKLLLPLQKAYQKYAYPLTKGTKIACSVLGSYSGVFGAAVLALSENDEVFI